MGRKYEEYEDATRELKAARENKAVANGGSTRNKSTEAHYRLEAAQSNHERTWNDMMDDPEG